MRSWKAESKTVTLREIESRPLDVTAWQENRQLQSLRRQQGDDGEALELGRRWSSKPTDSRLGARLRPIALQVRTQRSASKTVEKDKKILALFSNFWTSSTEGRGNASSAQAEARTSLPAEPAGDIPALPAKPAGADAEATQDWNEAENWQNSLINKMSQTSSPVWVLKKVSTDKESPSLHPVLQDATFKGLSTGQVLCLAPSHSASIQPASISHVSSV